MLQEDEETAIDVRRTVSERVQLHRSASEEEELEEGVMIQRSCTAAAVSASSSWVSVDGAGVDEAELQ